MAVRCSVFDVECSMFDFGPVTSNNERTSFAVAVRVLEIKQLMAGGDITTAIAVGQDAGGNEQAGGEHGGFVGFAIAIGVFEHNDGIRGGLAGFDLRIDFRAGDPQPAARVPVDFNRLVQLRVFGPEIDLEPVGDFEGGDGGSSMFGVRR